MVVTQEAFTCSKLTIETLGNVIMFEVSNKDTEMKSFTSFFRF